MPGGSLIRGHGPELLRKRGFVFYISRSTGEVALPGLRRNRIFRFTRTVGFVWGVGKLFWLFPTATVPGSAVGQFLGQSGHYFM